MEITTIKMSLKLSKETPAGWRGLELGAEATIGKGENLETATNTLYAALRNQFAHLWNQNGVTSPNGNNCQHEQPTPEPVITVETKQVEAPHVFKPRENGHGDYSDPASDAQIKCIFGKAKAMGLPSRAVKEMALAAYSTPIDNLNKYQASEFINALSNGKIPARA